MKPNDDAAATAPAPSGLGTMAQAFPGVASPAPTQRAETVTRNTVSKPKPRVKRKVSPVFSLGIEALMCVALLGVSGLLWYWDGSFTLTFLTKHFPTLDAWLYGYGQWVIPVAITILTLAAWPRKELREAVAEARKLWRQSQNDEDWLEYTELRRVLRVKVTIFTVVGMFNLGTSFSGLLIWGKGRAIDLFVGFTIPTAGVGLWAFAGIVGVICSYGPEKIARWALGYLDRLRHVWNQRGIA